MSFDNFNKVAGAALGAVLIFMLLGFFSGQIFGTRYEDHHAPLAFAIDIEDETEVSTAASDGISRRSTASPIRTRSRARRAIGTSSR